MACRQSLDQEVDHVRECVEKCMLLYMNKRDTVNFLATHYNILPAITRIVWVSLERENSEFFRAYYVRLAVQDQIMKFNRLLSAQVELIRQSELFESLSVNANQFDSNGSYTAPQILIPNSVQGIMQQEPENMNHMYALTNNGLSIQESTQQVFDHSVLPQNMFAFQNSDMVSDFDFGIPSNFMRPNPPMGDATVSLFDSGDNSTLQFDDYLASRVVLDQHQQASAPEYPVHSLSSSGRYLDAFLLQNGVWEQFPPVSTHIYPLDSSSCTGNVEKCWTLDHLEA